MTLLIDDCQKGMEKSFLQHSRASINNRAENLTQLMYENVFGRAGQKHFKQGFQYLLFA